MTIFRTDDHVSIQVFFWAIFSASILLSMTYIFLRFYQNKVIKKNDGKVDKLINVMESKYVPSLGHLFLISVDDQNFLAINSKFGTKIVQISRENSYSGIEDKG